MQMMADIDRRNAEKAKESAQKPENEAQSAQIMSLPSAHANTTGNTEEKTGIKHGGKQRKNQIIKKLSYITYEFQYAVYIIIKVILGRGVNTFTPVIDSFDSIGYGVGLYLTSYFYLTMLWI